MLTKKYYLFFEFIKKEFYQRYIGSVLGFWWAFIQPVVTIGVLWFIFQVGFKVQPVQNTPFILWLITGMLPWFFISDAITSATAAITDNTHLVKKILFDVKILPLIKIASAFIIHLLFILILIIIFIFYGYNINIYWLQLIYYMFASLVFVTGFTYITSSLIIFFRDIGMIIGIMLQIGFWVTPIFWNIDTIPHSYEWIIKANPVFYVVEGYRASLIYHEYFFCNINYTLYFWFVAIVQLIAGYNIFKKLRPHFADIL